MAQRQPDSVNLTGGIGRVSVLSPSPKLLNAACGVSGVRSYSTVRACLLVCIVRASHVRQHLGVVHRRAPSVHGVIVRVLLQTEQHAGVVFMVFYKTLDVRQRVEVWLTNKTC